MGLFRKRPNTGALLLAGAAAGDPAAQRRVELRRAEGVTDNDILTWYALSEKHRERTAITHNAYGIATYRYEKDRGATEQEAIDAVRRGRPFFSNAEEIDDPENLKGDDRPLPWELEPRVSAWGATKGLQLLREHGIASGALRGEYSSVNARIRAEMARGEL